MASLKKANILPTDDVASSKWNIHSAARYGDGWLNYNDKQVLSAQIGQDDYCCGLATIGSFDFGTVKFPAEELPKELKKYFDGKADDEVPYAYYQLTITRGGKTTKPHQPQWFIDALNKWPGSAFSEWRRNPNSGNDIQVWLLPV